MQKKQGEFLQLQLMLLRVPHDRLPDKKIYALNQPLCVGAKPLVSSSEAFQAYGPNILRVLT